MGIYAVKPAFQRRLVSIRDACVRAGISADALTIIALIASVAGGAVIALSPQVAWLLLLVPFLAMGRIATNALDGMVAVTTGTARPFGEVFNEFADRLSDSAWFLGLAFVIDDTLALGTLVIVLLSSYLGTVAKAAGGRRIYDGVMGKADRMILFSAASLVAYFAESRVWTYLAWFVSAGAVVTILQRLAIARRELPAKRKGADAP